MSFERFSLGSGEWEDEQANAGAHEGPALAHFADVTTSVRDHVASMEHYHRPPRYSERAWYTLLSDLRSFTDQWLDLALGCGWTLNELYGAPRNLSARRVDQVGVTLLLDGRQIVSIDTNRIIIENGTDGPSIFYRHAPGVSVPFDRSRGRPIWETLRLFSGGRPEW